MSDIDHNGIIPSIEEDEPNGNGTMDSIKSNASAALDAVQNHPMTQNIVNGPIADGIKDESAKTSAEFSNLAASRKAPEHPTATGQQLTHYHSFFASLLSWNNPRASGIAYTLVVALIFAARYLDLFRYSMKLTYMTLFVTLVAEVAGKALFSKGLTSQFRPKKYFTVSKTTLDSLSGDVHELINFFVIESQRILFVEDVFSSAIAFLGAFISYFLIKFVPIWGLALIGTSVTFLIPLIYKTNKEVIDQHIENLSNIINQQTAQVKQLASHHAARYAETTKQYVGDYSTKAQEIIGNARNRSVSPLVAKKEPIEPVTNGVKEESPAYNAEDFPTAPQEDFKSPVEEVNESEPLISV